MGRYISINQQKENKNITEVIAFLKGAFQAALTIIIGVNFNLYVGIIFALALIAIHYYIDKKNSTAKSSGLGWYIMFLVILVILLAASFADEPLLRAGV